MKTVMKPLALMFAFVLLSSLFVLSFSAETEDASVLTTGAVTAVQTDEESTEDGSAVKAIAAAGVIAVVAGIGAVCMGWSIVRSAESTSRRPEAADHLRTSLMLGLVFIETVVIYALIIAILIIFVL